MHVIRRHILFQILAFAHIRKINLKSTDIKMPGLQGIVPPGVVTGANLLKLMEYCRDNEVALPAFNCTSSSTINAVLEAARDIK